MNTETQADGRSERAQKLRTLRRDEILQAAKRLLAEKGYQKTSVSDVIEAAGISRGTFYLYFESREALFHDLVNGFIRDLKKRVKPIILENGNPLEQLRETLLHISELLFRHRDLTTILLREAIGQDKEMDRTVNELNDFLQDMISRALQNGMRWRLIRKVHPEIVAMAILGSIREVLYQYLVVNQREIPQPEEIVDELLYFGYQGLVRSSFAG